MLVLPNRRVDALFGCKGASKRASQDFKKGISPDEQEKRGDLERRTEEKRWKSAITEKNKSELFK